jgi:hypothetical protein
MKHQDRRPAAALLSGAALFLLPPVRAAEAGCAAEPPALVAAPRQMPSNGALSLVLTHPLWHSRRAATGPVAPSGALGGSAEDLPFVLLQDGASEPLALKSTHPLARGQVAVELAPAAGWRPSATYELRADVGTKHVYPAFTALSTRDEQPPTWSRESPTAEVIRPKAADPPPAPRKRCTTTGSGKTKKTECITITYDGRMRTEERCVTRGVGTSTEGECTVSVGGSVACPPDITEPHVLLHLPAVHDDQGGVVLLEITAGANTTRVAAAREVRLGLSAACSPPNFPPPEASPYELQVTPIDAAQNRGVTLKVAVNPASAKSRP